MEIELIPLVKALIKLGVLDPFKILSGSGSGFGEINTGSNVNTAGVGIFKQKTGVNLEFRGVAPGSSKILTVLNALTNTVDVDVNVAGFTTNHRAIYVDADNGDDTTGSGGILAPYETLPKAISEVHPTDKTVIILAPGDYIGAAVAIPYNVSMTAFGGGTVNIAHDLTYTALVSDTEATLVFEGINFGNFSFDLTLAGQAIPTFYQCSIGKLTRLDTTGGAHFIQVFDSYVSDFSIKGNVSMTGVLFVGSGTVEDGGTLLLFGDIQGTVLNVYGTGTISMVGCTFPGLINGFDVGLNTPTVRVDATSLSYGGTISGATLILIDSASSILNVPSGNVVSTNVQAAINELDGKITDSQNFAIAMALALG